MFKTDYTARTFAILVTGFTILIICVAMTLLVDWQNQQGPFTPAPACAARDAATHQCLAWYGQ